MNDVNYVKNNYTDLRNISNNLNVRPFNPELPGSLRPQGKFEEKVMNWEESLILSLNNINKIEKDDYKTSYVKYKLIKPDIYGLALVDTGNLVKGTLVSSKFWDMIGGKMSKREILVWAQQRKEGKDSEY